MEQFVHILFTHAFVVPAMSNVYVHFSLISFPARYSVVNLRLESHSLRFREVIFLAYKTPVPKRSSLPSFNLPHKPFFSFIVAVAAGVACHYIIKWLDSDE